MTEHAFSPLIIKGRTLLPIVQGGMGVGVSAHRLAGAVAKEGGVGTIASVDLRHLHADLVEESAKFTEAADYDRLNLIALDREVKAALDIAQGHGMVSVNVMKVYREKVLHVHQNNL
jgi:nitronate monooxygenase